MGCGHSRSCYSCSITMLLKLNTDDDRPLYHQIASAVRGAVRTGTVSNGDRLPATRDLAASLGVNMHTVLRAYALLKEEGLIELRRGRGAIVLEVSSAAAVEQLIVELVEVAREQGLEAREVIALVNREFS